MNVVSNVKCLHTSNKQPNVPIMSWIRKVWSTKCANTRSEDRCSLLMLLLPSSTPWRVQIAAARGRANWSWTQNSYFLAKMPRAIDIQLSLPSQCSKIDPVFSIEVIAWRPALYFIINQAPRPRRSGMQLQLQSAVQRNGKMRSWIFHL